MRFAGIVTGRFIVGGRFVFPYQFTQKSVGLFGLLEQGAVTTSLVVADGPGGCSPNDAAYANDGGDDVVVTPYVRERHGRQGWYRQRRRLGSICDSFEESDGGWTEIRRNIVLIFL